MRKHDIEIATIAARVMQTAMKVVGNDREYIFGCISEALIRDVDATIFDKNIKDMPATIEGLVFASWDMAEMEYPDKAPGETLKRFKCFGKLVENKLKISNIDMTRSDMNV